jgi:peptidyl-tRNA hydrolase, PTH1 family
MKKIFCKIFFCRYAAGMKWNIIGLGNPGDEYERSPHNVGREAVEYFATKKHDAVFAMQSKAQSLVAKCTLQTHTVTCILPDTFMNKSGVAGAYFAKTTKDIERSIVIHDDLDLPLGTIKIGFNRGSGGHKGVESLKRAWKTEAFVRVRIGVSPESKKGDAKKVKGEEKVINYILKPFKDDAYTDMKKVYKKIAEALDVIILESREKAMTQYNGRVI